MRVHYLRSPRIMVGRANKDHPPVLQRCGFCVMGGRGLSNDCGGGIYGCGGGIYGGVDAGIDRDGSSAGTLQWLCLVKFPQDCSWRRGRGGRGGGGRGGRGGGGRGGRGGGGWRGRGDDLLSDLINRHLVHKILCHDDVCLVSKGEVIGLRGAVCWEPAYLWETPCSCFCFFSAVGPGVNSSRATTAKLWWWLWWWWWWWWWWWLRWWGCSGDGLLVMGVDTVVSKPLLWMSEMKWCMRLPFSHATPLLTHHIRNSSQSPPSSCHRQSQKRQLRGPLWSEWTRQEYSQTAKDHYWLTDSTGHWLSVDARLTMHSCP